MEANRLEVCVCVAYILLYFITSGAHFNAMSLYLQQAVCLPLCSVILLVVWHLKQPPHSFCGWKIKSNILIHTYWVLALLQVSCNDCLPQLHNMLWTVQRRENYQSFLHKEHWYFTKIRYFMGIFSKWGEISGGSHPIDSKYFSKPPTWYNLKYKYRRYWLTLTVLVTTIDAQWEGMGDVGSARYEPALLPSCPTIRVLSCSN